MAVTSAPSHEDLYRARRDPELVVVPPARFLMIDGRGSPDGTDFQDAIGALYSIAYTAKFALKKAGGPNVKVPPLEGLYDRFADPRRAFEDEVRAQFRWTLMIRLPDAIDDDTVARARAEAARKKELPALPRVRVEAFEEGTSVQVLHVGPYSEELGTVERLIAFADGLGRTAHGRHHEIYISAPGRTKPERMKTILRQPVT